MSEKKPRKDKDAVTSVLGGISSIPILLNRIFKHDTQGMLAAIAVIMVIGIINIFSSTFVKDNMDGIGMNYHLVRQFIYYVVGGLAAWFMYFVNYERIFNNKRNAKLLAWATVIALLLVFPMGEVVNGARRWIHLPGNVAVQPSEFAKLTAVLWAAHCLSKGLDFNRVPELWKDRNNIPYLKDWDNRNPIGNIIKGLASLVWPGNWNSALLMPVIFAVITIKQPDMGTAVLILGFPAALLALSGLKPKTLGMSVLLGLAIFLFAALTSPYRRERIMTMYDPFSHAQDLGYQAVQSIVAVGSGGVTGQGIGMGTSKYLFLPEAHTDFAFAVWSQETGLLGSLILLLAVLLFTYYGIRITLKAHNSFSALVAAGITLIISGQALFNMLMVSGLAPVTGVPLPFVSYGGSSLVMNCMAVALLANISNRTDWIKSKKIGGVGVIPSIREETQSRFKPQRLNEY